MADRFGSSREKSYRSRNRALAALVQSTTNVVSTDIDGLDSAATIALINNTATGLDSAQVLSIAGTAGLDSAAVLNIALSGYGERKTFIQSSAPTFDFQQGDFWWDRDGNTLYKASPSTSFTSYPLPAGTMSQYPGLPLDARGNHLTKSPNTTSANFTFLGVTQSYPNTGRFATHGGTYPWEPFDASNTGVKYTLTTPTLFYAFHNGNTDAGWIYKIEYEDGSYAISNNANPLQEPTSISWFDASGNSLNKTVAFGNGTRILTHPSGVKCSAFVVARGTYGTRDYDFWVFFQGADYWRPVGEMYLDSDGVRSHVTADYINSLGISAGLDSSAVTTLIDSAYISARSGALDSAETLALITGGNAITVTSGVVNHDDTSSQASVNNTGSNFIQDITLDTYGHVTAITSAEAGGGGGGLGVYGVVNSTGTAASATGTDAIAIGETAVASGADGIAIGKKAMSGNTGSLNVAIGSDAALNSGNANSSVYLGAYCGYASTGHSSTYLGYSAGQYKSGYQNIAIGLTAYARTSGSGIQNIFVGYRAGWDATSCSGNTAMGHQVLQNITSGLNNTAIGLDAGTNLTTGYENVFIGKQCGQIITTGRNNVVIGQGALSGANATNGQTYNSIYIGNGNICSGYRNLEIVLGVGLTGKGNNTSYMGANSNYNPGNNSSWNTTSDERIKTNIADYTLGLDTLGQVTVKTYNYLSDSAIAAAHPELADSDGLVHERLNTEKTIVGIMAQELEAVLPNSVETRDNGIKSVNKDELFWVMLNSIKELKTANDSLVARVEALENAP